MFIMAMIRGNAGTSGPAASASALVYSETNAVRCTSLAHGRRTDVISKHEVDDPLVVAL